MKRAFTFWEPRDSMPGYVRLCLETWNGRLPGYETTVLDQNSLGDYLSPAERDEIACPRDSLAMQADCVRCALLKKYGGIWLDADTVLTKPLDPRLLSADVTMVARREGGALVNYGAYIHATGPETKVISEWHRRLLPRIRKSRLLRGSFFRRILDRRGWKEVRGWDYYENAILDPLTSQLTPPDYAWVDKDGLGAFPEEALLADGRATTPFDAYVRYWFAPGAPEPALERCAGLIMLHNSWTPEKYRGMSAEAFLDTDTRLAAVLRMLLGK